MEQPQEVLAQLRGDENWLGHNSRLLPSYGALALESRQAADLAHD